MGRFYVTTPIYYVNDVPHLGTAYTTVITDALKRFHRVVGDETFMLTGTDEHGQKIEEEAVKAGVAPKAFCDQISERFREAWPKLDVEYDRFIRTTDADHEAFVVDLWKKIEANGDLYLGDYEAWYCVGCESFKTEKELVEGNLCPLHKRPVEKVKEKTYFFRLSKYQDKLLDLFARRPEMLQPETRRNEVLSFIKGGLEDLSCSRTSFKWGIPVPSNPEHVMYVWFDALTNYRSALGSGELTKFWAPDGQVVHLVGKDILRFHTIFWPAFLLAAGYREDQLPQICFAHGFLTIDGEKMSKALRNAVDPLKLAAELGADTIRYFLLRAVAFGQDGDFNHAGLLERYNADLGKNLGNLLNRVLGLCTKMTDGKHPSERQGDGKATIAATPHAQARTAMDAELYMAYAEHTRGARKAWLELAPHLALEHTMKLGNAANAYVDRAAPWVAAKEGDMARVEIVLSHLLRVLEALSVMLWPAMPKKSDAMRAQLGLPALDPTVGKDLWPTDLPAARGGLALAPAGPLFPTYDDEKQKELLDKLVPKKETPVVETTKPAVEAKPLATTAPEEAPAEIAYDDFGKVDLRLGVVLTAAKVPKKDKLLRLTVDLGEASPRQIVAGLALSFKPEELVGRRVIVVANLAPRDFGSVPAADGKGKEKLVSHGMLLAAGPSEALSLATVPHDETRPVAPGTRLK